MNRQLLAVCCYLGICYFSHAQTAKELISQGDAFDAKGQTTQALGAYLQASELKPAQPAGLWVKIAKQQGESMCDAGSSEAKIERGKQALASAEKALAADPKLAEAHLAMAVCYGRLLSLVPAKTKVEYSRLVKSYAETAIKLDPKSDLAWHMLGRWHQACADLGGVTRGIVKMVYGALPDASFDEAIKCFKKAEQLNPQRVCHKIELGLTYLKTGQKDLASVALQNGLALPNRERDDPETKARGKAALSEM
jgi:tetratricopeptide (TPR) repeat protein